MLLLPVLSLSFKIQICVLGVSSYHFHLFHSSVLFVFSPFRASMWIISPPLFFFSLIPSLVGSPPDWWNCLLFIYLASSSCSIQLNWWLLWRETGPNLSLLSLPFSSEALPLSPGCLHSPEPQFLSPALWVFLKALWLLCLLAAALCLASASHPMSRINSAQPEIASKKLASPHWASLCYGVWPHGFCLPWQLFIPSNH